MRILLLLVVLPLAWAQFPAVCNTPGNLSTKTCCPDNCGSHGSCVSIREEVERRWNLADQDIVGAVCNGIPNQDWRKDVRCQWPVMVFNRVCRCDPGWGGYDCSDCDFGFIANAAGECVNRSRDQLLVRRNFKDLTDKERTEYFDIVKKAKNEEEKKWAVVVGEPKDGSSFTLENVSTYDMLVVHHFLPTRETDNKKCKEIVINHLGKEINFAHENSTFLTWHRYYLLIVEKEFRRIAESMNIANFTLAYWDWTEVGSNKIFTSDVFGEHDHTSMRMNVNGKLFVSDWPVVCDKHYQEYLNDNEMGGMMLECHTVRELCNISAERANYARLQRGVVTKGHRFLPDDGSIEMALTADKYDEADGFNQRVEGFVELCAGEDKPCWFLGEKIHNNLHNAVHIYLGGHMSDVPTASNDPVFFLHHANVDRIFEAWLRKFSGNLPPYMPISGGHPGHNCEDYLVPFFPLKTNADMYNISSDLGFDYESLPWKIEDMDFAMCMNVSEADTCKKLKGGTSTSSNPTTAPMPDAGSSDLRVPLHLILTAGTCAVLIASKLFN